MLIIKVWGIPTHILSSGAFNIVLESWKSQLAFDVSNVEALKITPSNVHIIFPSEGQIGSPPKKLVVEINGSTLRFATRSMSLAEIEQAVQGAIAPWYQNIPLYVTANYDDNS